MSAPPSSRARWAALAPAIVAGLVACSSSADPPPGLSTDASTGTKPGPSGSPTLDSADGGADAATCKTVPPSNRCGLDPQCGCGPNETCDVTTHVTGATSCVTGGGATLGRPCAQTGDCVAGLTCQYGACRPYCSTPRTPCTVSGTALCVEVIGTDNKPEPNNAICTITCDPRAPQGVCGTNACLWFPTYYSPSKVSDCNYGGTTGPQGKCSTDSDCQPGLACMNHPKYGLECERWCRIGVAGDCTTPFKCVDVLGADAPVIGGVKEGSCQD